MQTKLFITPEQVKSTTMISGTTDKDSLNKSIYSAQITDITRILGDALYDKIYADLDAGTPLTGEYKKIFDKYIIDMHIYFSASDFVLFNEVKPSNVGNTILSTEYGRPTDKTPDESEKYKNKAISIEENFRTYMEKSTLTEWSWNKKGEQGTNFNSFY